MWPVATSPVLATVALTSGPAAAAARKRTTSATRASDSDVGRRPDRAATTRGIDVWATAATSAAPGSSCRTSRRKAPTAIPGHARRPKKSSPATASPVAGQMGMTARLRTRAKPASPATK